MDELTKTDRPPEVAAAVQQLDGIISCQMETISLLERRLESVLRPEPSDPGVNKEETLPGLAGYLVLCGRRMEGNTTRIRRMLERLEV